MRDILKSYFSVSLLILAFIVPEALFAQRLESFDRYFAGSSIGPVQTKESKHFKAQWIHPRDEIFIDALLAHMEAARASLEKEFALAMSEEEKVPLEIYPNLEDFSAVSKLSLSRFRATGTIALTLEQRLMLLSPRNLVSGYSWAETAVHEYAHYLINRVAPGHIPIWLHEGTAQIFQEFPYKKIAQLRPSQWGLFKRRRDAGTLHTLAILREPFPMRETPEDAELAYIQALLFSNWLRESCGILDLIANAYRSGSIKTSLEACTQKSMAEIESVFISEIMGQIKIPEGSDVAFFARHFSSDEESPLEIEGKKSDKKSRNLATLSQQMFKQGRFRASAIEMEKALDVSDIDPPSWRRQMAVALQKNGNDLKSASVLEALVTEYPEDAGAWYLLGLGLMSGDDPKAPWQRFLRAFYQNPFLEGLEQSMNELTNQNPELKNQLLLAPL